MNNASKGVSIFIPEGVMTEEQFYQFCMRNPELRIEQTTDRMILVREPTNSYTGNHNFELITEIGIWNRNIKLGKGFDSSTGFRLPNGAERSPDAAWISLERWDAIPEEARHRFAPVCPDFVAEIRSPDQSLSGLKDKMEEYMECGARLGWLIDPQNRETWVYWEKAQSMAVAFDQPLQGGDVLPGFEVRMDELWG
jgi:Uma2 family endonuclease